MIKVQGHKVKHTDFHIFNDNEKNHQTFFVKQNTKYSLYFGVYAYDFVWSYIE